MADLRLKESKSEQVSLTTTAVFTTIPKDVSVPELRLSCDVDYQLHLCPRLKVVTFFDNSAATYSANAATSLEDRSTSTVLTISDGEGGADFIYIGADEQFTGIWLDMVAFNVNASVLTMKYRQAAAWAAVGSGNDGSASGGATFGQDGLLKWAKPTDWIKQSLSSVNVALAHELYWIQLSWNNTLDAAVTIGDMILRNKQAGANYWYMYGSMVDTLEINFNQVGGFEAVVASGTGTLDVDYLGK